MPSLKMLLWIWSNACFQSPSPMDAKRRGKHVKIPFLALLKGLTKFFFCQAFCIGAK